MSAISSKPILEVEKDPDAILDYGLDWTAWLAGDTMSNSLWSAPAGITIETSSFGGGTTTVWLSGGTAGVAYDLVNHVTTTGGREDDRTMRVFVKNR